MAIWTPDRRGRGFAYQWYGHRLERQDLSLLLLELSWDAAFPNHLAVTWSFNGDSETT